MKHRIAFAAAALSASTGAAAADLLPLARGTYVREDVPCRRASNATTLSYRGGRNGLNIQRQICTIRRMTRRGATYSLGRNCEDIRDDTFFSDRVTVTIRDRRSFILHTPFTPPGGTRFRYCGRRAGR